MTGTRRSQGDCDPDPGPLAARTADLERPADRKRALMHRAQTEVSRVETIGVEPNPVIHDLERHCMAKRLEAHVDPPRLRMLDRIAQGLLGDSVEGVLHLYRGHWFVFHGGLSSEAVPGSERLDLLEESCNQALGL